MKLIRMLNTWYVKINDYFPFKTQKPTNINIMPTAVRQLGTSFRNIKPMATLTRISNPLDTIREKVKLSTTFVRHFTPYPIIILEDRKRGKSFI